MTNRAEISQSLFLEIVDAINNASTLQSLFNSVMELLPLDLASYHHFPSVGALDHKTLGTFHGYNLPESIISFYKTYDMRKPDPVIVSIFARGGFVWLSDLISKPGKLDADQISIAENTLRGIGDALCVPLFGPKNRRGYLFLSGGIVKKENGAYLAHQVQALGQVFHSRFCLIIQKFKGRSI